MQEEPKQPSPAQAVPKLSEPVSGPSPAQETAPAQSTPNKLGFPSSMRAAPTQAPLYTGILAVGVLVGVLLSSVWTSRPGETPAISSTAAEVEGLAAAAATTTPKTTSTEPPLTVEDQPAGPSVAISHINIARPTWVVVYVSREGKPGNALGARLYFPADKQGKVGLLRNTEAGQSYFVGLSVDDGDRAFSLSKDKPLADADGGPLWATFTAR